MNQIPVDLLMLNCSTVEPINRKCIFPGTYFISGDLHFNSTSLLEENASKLMFHCWTTKLEACRVLDMDCGFNVQGPSVNNYVLLYNLFFVKVFNKRSAF